jgi:predicted ATPase/DNA-binding CsgD family transcriptional regulator
MSLYDELTDREKQILQALAEGSADKQIADDLFLSSNTIRWYNRQIYSKLGVSNRTQAVAYAQEHGLLRTAVSVAQFSVPNHSLPSQNTPFIGRQREIAEVVELLNNSRLLSLTGMGGTGKTRLALGVATSLIETFPDGLYFIDLSPLSDYKLVAKAISESLNILENSAEPLVKTLKRVLAQRKLLLLIDNFEHLIEAAPLVSDLLAACSHLKVLVTSREALRLSGEQEYAVPTLSLPSGEKPSSLMESEAGMLFVQRAQMKKHNFEITDENAPAIAQICTRLDGLPLAIELAAAQSKFFSPKTLLERLDSGLDALGSGSRDAPARQQSLRNTIEWSYKLLNEGEKCLFARLAVFRGGCSLEALEAVCHHDLPIDIFDGLASLVDKSLVQLKESPKGDPRVSMLETIIEYARQRLEASGEAEQIYRRRAEYFVALAERIEPELRRIDYDYWSQQFEIEHDNFRSILEWSLSQGELSLGLRLASAISLFWLGKGFHLEGIQWTQRFLERLDETPLSYHPKFILAAGYLMMLHNLDAARTLFERQLQIARGLNDKTQEAWALIFLGYTLQQEPDTAMPIAEEGLALLRELHHLPGIAQALNIIAEIARVNGDDERAKQAYEECLSVCQKTGEGRRMCYMYYGLCHIAQHEGNHESALEFGQRGLRLATERNDTNEMANGISVIAGSFILLGQAQLAARLLGASEAAAERTGAFHHPSDKPELARIIHEVQMQLGHSHFQAAWAEGRTMSLEQAVEIALQELS